jgi:hypothetical protein
MLASMLATHASPLADLIILDILGKLYSHGRGIGGNCRTCRRYFRVPMPVLSAVRGPDRVKA